MPTYKHWNIALDAIGIGWLNFNRADSRVNTLNYSVLEELDSIVEAFLEKPPPVGLVLYSGKKTGFIAGADITEFKTGQQFERAKTLLEKGQAVFDKIAHLPFPTVALIEGFCLGGGLELALACRYRVASLDPKVRMGLPEVKLGLHPGWGGSIRLPRLIGSLQALPLIVSGRSVHAKVAQKIGLVDFAVFDRHLKEAVYACFQQLPSTKSPPFYERFFKWEFLRRGVGKLLMSRLAEKVNPKHYPAPFAVLENWIAHSLDSKVAYRAEIDSFLAIMESRTAQNLMRVFFLQERLKKPEPLKKVALYHVHVVGAGTMGGEIAALCSLKGFKVTVSDPSLEAISRMLLRAEKLFQRVLKQPHLVKDALDRLQPDKTATGLKTADFVIEAVIEELALKQKIFQELEQRVSPEALIATNTSTIPLEKISAALKNPKRLVGIHFFNPVSNMRLVEIVSSPETEPACCAKAIAFSRSLDKLPLPVKSAPGFLVNRLLMPYLLESMVLLEGGISPYRIDEAAKSFGMPMGPLELADTVGLDVCLFAAKQLSNLLQLEKIPQNLIDLVNKNHLGKKTQHGFYRYKKNKPLIEPISKKHTPVEDLTDRLLSPLFNEAVAALKARIVEDADLLDAGMIFGTGFAPFLGGPLHFLSESAQLGDQ